MNIAKPGAQLQNTKNAFKAAKAIGMHRHAQILLGLPGENVKTLKNTKKFLFELDADTVTVNFLTPYPGTKLFDIAEQNNWIINHKWNNYSSFEVVMVPPNLTAKDLYETSRQIEKKFIIQNRKILLNDLNLASFKLLIISYLQGIMNNLRFRKLINASKKRPVSKIREQKNC
jgi:radical SAM superfamily enzyme YgiQ (UPF0313 family)